MADTRIKLGRILSPTGTQGWVNFFPYVDVLFAWEDVKTVQIEQQDGTLLKTELKNFNIQKKTKLRFACIDSRESADRFRQCDAWISEADVPDLPDGEFYEYELIGQPVTLENGGLIGKVSQLIPSGDSNILVINGQYGEVMIPINKENVASMSGDGIVIHPIDGLLELNQR